MKKSVIAILLLGCLLVSCGKIELTMEANTDADTETIDTTVETDEDCGINVDRGAAVGEVVDNNTIDESLGVLGNIKEHITMDMENWIPTLSDELKAEIYKQLPIFAEYPEEYQIYTLEAYAIKYKDSTDGTGIIADIQKSMDNYYRNGNDEKYGPGPAGTEPQDTSTLQPGDHLSTQIEKPSTAGKTAISSPTYTDSAGWVFVDTGKKYNGNTVYETEGDYSLYVIYSDGTMKDVGFNQEKFDREGGTPRENSGHITLY